MTNKGIQRGKSSGSKAPAKTGERYLYGFTIASETSSSNYKISFDTAKGCWMCSCRGCVGHQKTCKHLRACGLIGPENRNQAIPSKAQGQSAQSNGRALPSGG